MGLMRLSLMLSIALFVSPSWAAIAPCGTAVSNTTGTATTTLSVTFDATGCNALYIGVAGDDIANTATATFNSVSATQLSDAGQVCVGDRAYSFLQLAPSQGSFTATVTFSASQCASSGCAIHVTGFSGVEQSSVSAATRTEATNALCDGSTQPTITVTDSQNGDMVVGTLMAFGNTLTEGQTLVVENENMHGSGSSVGTQRTSASGANTTLTWTGSTAWVAVAVALVPSAPGGCRLLQNGTDKRLLQNGTMGRILQGGGDCGFGGGPPPVVPVRMLTGVGL